MGGQHIDLKFGCLLRRQAARAGVNREHLHAAGVGVFFPGDDRLKAALGKCDGAIGGAGQIVGNDEPW